MTERELWVRYYSLFQQIHATVIYEDEILQKISMRELYIMRDNILDEMIFLQQQLKLRL